MNTPTARSTGNEFLRSNNNSILWDPGAVSRVGRKGATKVFNQAKEPPGTDSHRTISKNSSGCRLLIGDKKCFVLFCPMGKQFLLSYFREFVHDRYCLATHFTKLVRVRETFIFYFPNQKRRNYRWVEKTFGMLSAGAIQFVPRRFCFWLITMHRK